MSIAKETLFRAIMRNEALLWVGSGFSLYAGYPSGWGFAQMLQQGLTSSQQPMMNPNDPLPRYVEQYITLHNGRRNELNRELLRVFTAAPKSLETHQQLVAIPFIDQIVTTNYDNLFELAYGHRLHKVTQGKNIPLGEPNQVVLYKIHGDLQDPDSIIIADKDFRGFFQKNDKILWTALEALMAKRHIVFVGYSLEDPNVKQLYELILELLGSQMREAFFIAPAQSELNRKWMEKNNLTYIDSTGETFVTELIAELKESVLPNLKKGLVSQDKASQFLNELGMNFGYKSNSQGLDITYLAKKEGLTHQEITFSVKNATPSSESLRRAVNGDTLEPVRLSSADEFKAIIRVGGLRIADDVVDIIIMPTASLKKSVDIFFADGTYFSDVKIAIYGSKKQVRILAKSDFNTVKITLHRKGLDKIGKGLNFNVEVGGRGDSYASVKALIENSEIARCLGQGLGFVCKENGRVVYEGQTHEFVAKTVEAANKLRIFVEDMLLIEREFSILFKNFKLCKSEWDSVVFLARILRLESGKSPWRPPLTFGIDDSDEGKQWKQTFSSPNYLGSIALEQTETWKFDIFGWKLEIETRGMHILNNASVRFNKKTGKYSATNNESELHFIVNSIVDKRIVEYPLPAVKLDKPTLEDFIERYE